MKITTLSEKQTINLGGKMAKKLQGGETIGLIGELGAGKTILVKGFAKGLGIKETITSPTFVLMKVYQIKNEKNKKFCHIDAYRIKNGQSLINIGAQEYLNKPKTITIIEWADQVKDILPKNTIFVKIKSGYKKNIRTIEIK